MSIEAQVNFAVGPVGDVPGAVPLPEAKLPKDGEDESSGIPPIPGILEDLSNELGSAGVNAEINFASGPVGDVPGAVPLPTL